MNTVRNLGRAQQRELKKLAAAIDRVIEGDRRFFARRRERNYRLRIASRPEIAANAACGTDTSLPAGYRWFCAVKQVAPGARVRAIFAARAENDPDASEEACRDAYENAAGEAGRPIEVQVLEASLATRAGAR
jgi:hypothetical protein